MQYRSIDTGIVRSISVIIGVKIGNQSGLCADEEIIMHESMRFKL